MFDLIATAAAAAAPQAKQNPFTSMIPVFLIVIVFMLSHPEKAYSPIALTESGIVMLVSAEQSENA